ncbi:hemerythrin domain-containing protein [Oceanicola sp. 22II-s10i]|uniref:hemerythrin domain-containing protein n=1 Tax=Oceanicola sp. 22II-s10i TaxID=1317116 RepID=UPI0020CD4C68|nr:hemerythrin domain-containing protein [Oceanicola sp. 22II-s10i]
MTLRQGLPDEMQFLLRAHPRETWPDHPNFARSVQNWMGAHATFRTLASYVTEDTARFLDKEIDERTYAHTLAKYGHILIRNLHGHHTWEDRTFFPELGAAEGRLQRGLDILEADHEALDATLDSFARGANRVVQLAQLSPVDVAREVPGVEKDAATIAALLDRHLADEEDLVVPIILEHRLRG